MEGKAWTLVITHQTGLSLVHLAHQDLLQQDMTHLAMSYHLTIVSHHLTIHLIMSYHLTIVLYHLTKHLIVSYHFTPYKIIRIFCIRTQPTLQCHTVTQYT